jgi:rhamnosyl/mannosyltransferase
MLNVLHLGKYDAVGGIERHVQGLLTGLLASGRVAPVNLVAADRARTDMHARHGYPTHRAACFGNLFSVALSPRLPLLARELDRQHRFDVVHLHFPDPLGMLTASLLPRRVRRVVAWHSDVVRQRAALAIYQPLLDRFMRQVDMVIAATPRHFSGSTQIPEWLPPDRRRVIPYGFDPGVLAPSPRGEALRADLLAQKSGRTAVFALGRHVYYKGFEVLIDAMRAFDAVLWLGGDGPLTDRFRERIAAQGLQDRVRLTGRIADEELFAYYAACDIFCLPSVAPSEAFGLVQLEAMSMARPVVSCALGTGVDWVNQHGETGLVVPPSDAAALAQAMQTLARDPALRARLGEAGRRRVHEVFSMRQMIEQTLDVYERVCGRTA